MDGDYFGGAIKSLQLALHDFPRHLLFPYQLSWVDIAEDVFNNPENKDLVNELPLEVFKPYNNLFHSAIEGLDEERAKLLKNNATMFAAAKTAKLMQNLIAIRRGTTDKDAFMQLARRTINTFNRYSAAEYNTMVHRTRIVKQWEQFEAETMYPNIEWLPSRAATPDEVHRGYWNHVWAKTDPFWLNNFPGCRWGCKCSWRTTDAPPTGKGQLKPVPPSPGLEGNPYFTNEMISRNHPYYYGIPKHIPKLGVLHNPDEVVYLDYITDDNKSFQVHFLARDEFDRANSKFVPYLFNAGFKDIRFLPAIEHKKNPTIKRYFGNYAGHGCADVLADGNYVGLKEVGAGKKLLRNMKDNALEGLLKADILFIRIKGKITAQETKDFFKYVHQRRKNKKIFLINKYNEIIPSL